MSKPETFALVIHGGAGARPGRDYTAALKKLHEILESIGGELAGGGSALDAVVRAVAIMEDSALYTAGRGSAPNSDGFVELDASVMDGSTQNAGAIAAVRAVKNPVHAARTVLEKTDHVLLAGRGAESFLREANIAFIDDSDAYFRQAEPDDGRVHGTVGAVAHDTRGDLAAATSTGGIFRKLAGRVGDSPIPGAGVWADKNIAVSCTGHGEYFLRTAAARSIAALKQYKGLSLKHAMDTFLTAQLKPLGGDGGAIAIDEHNNIAANFTGFGMKYGYITDQLQPTTDLQNAYV
ncbi:MAG: isoaspartyl peptidase/L-asparaginase [Hyphomicrobiales bacterium]|nr:isoaspartyl peptidase/L-asparaginase [Hyphomicrobiales bacterium]MCY4053364.1 isoaspartyl peptidase/L-asparaginase [Hyphomicrobiales bacterium]